MNELHEEIFLLARVYPILIIGIMVFMLIVLFAISSSLKNIRYLLINNFASTLIDKYNREMAFNDKASARETLKQVIWEDFYHANKKNSSKKMEKILEDFKNVKYKSQMQEHNLEFPDFSKYLD